MDLTSVLKIWGNTLRTFYIWWNTNSSPFHVYRYILFALQKLAHTCEPVPCPQRSFQGAHAVSKKSSQDKNALPPGYLPPMPASQMTSSQETACLSMLDGTQKSPRAILSHWHLEQALSFPRGYSVNPVWKKAWRHSSKHRLDISKVLHGQMESLCLSICRLKAYQINLWSIATSVLSLPTVSNIS